MIQEIIVFILFFSIIGFTIYRFFFAKNKHSGGGCSKCASNPQSPNNRMKEVGKNS